jgi:hypothetical protein
MGPLLMTISWSILLSCSLGLFFLYKTTTADPGYIPTGWVTVSKAPACCEPCSPSRPTHAESRVASFKLGIHIVAGRTAGITRSLGCCANWEGQMMHTLTDYTL